MREADDEAVRRVRIVTDSALAVKESGDLCQPVANGVLRADAIDLLTDVVRGGERQTPGEQGITLFKSVGTALADLVAAEFLVGKARARG